MIQLTVGVMSDSRVVMIDRADMLDQDGWEGLGEGRGGRHGRQADVGSAVFDRRVGRDCAVASSGDQEGEDMKLQTERINQLADRIEQCKEVEIDAHTSDMGPAFSMCSSKYSCGSPACILGHWNAIRDSTTTAMTRFDYASLASDLGITRMQAA